MIPAHVRIFVCTEPVDLRRSFDGLALAARERLGHDPRAGGLFAFVNRRANRLKILWFDRNGYCLLYKRLHQAVFVSPAPPTVARPRSTAAPSARCSPASRARRARPPSGANISRNISCY
jgi:hypothetical protein